MPPLAENCSNSMDSARYINGYSDNQTKQTKPRRHSVSFAPQCKMWLIPHINDFRPSEIDSIYLKSIDYERIKAELHQSLDRIVKGVYNPDEDCFRGLENHTASGAAYRRNNRKMASDAVFDEQQCQWCEGIRSEDYIAMSYLEYTKRCQMEAELRGERDEIEVESAITAEFATKAAAAVAATTTTTMNGKCHLVDKPPQIAFRSSSLTKTI